MIAVLNKTENVIARLAPNWLASAVLRLALAVPFYFSGLTKWDSFGALSESAVFLFEEEFKINILGKAINYPFPFASAFAAGTSEIILPILLVLGFFTRFAALGLLIMTAVIQLTIPSGWPLHLTWAAMAIGILAMGPGRLSIDNAVRKTYSNVQANGIFCEAKVAPDSICWRSISLSNRSDLIVRCARVPLI